MQPFESRATAFLSRPNSLLPPSTTSPKERRSTRDAMLAATPRTECRPTTADTTAAEGAAVSSSSGLVLMSKTRRRDDSTSLASQANMDSHNTDHDENNDRIEDAEEDDDESGNWDTGALLAAVSQILGEHQRLVDGWRLTVASNEARVDVYREVLMAMNQSNKAVVRMAADEPYSATTVAAVTSVPSSGGAALRRPHSAASRKRGRNDDDTVDTTGEPTAAIYDRSRRIHPSVKPSHVASSSRTAAVTTTTVESVAVTSHRSVAAESIPAATAVRNKGEDTDGYRGEGTPPMQSTAAILTESPSASAAAAVVMCTPAEVREEFEELFVATTATTAMPPGVAAAAPPTTTGVKSTGHTGRAVRGAHPGPRLPGAGGAMPRTIASTAATISTDVASRPPAGAPGPPPADVGEPESTPRAYWSIGPF